MILHKILRGEGAEKYLPFGLARLRALERIKGSRAYWVQKFSVPGFTVEVEQSPPCQYVRVVATGGVKYEFFTSELIDASLSTPGYAGYVGGAGMRSAFTKTTTSTRPLFSTVLAPSGTDSWKLRATDAPSVDKETGFATYGSWQKQHFQEAAWYDEKHKKLVGSTRSQHLGAGGKANWRSPYFFTVYDRNYELTFDYGRDVPPSLYTAAGATVSAPDLGDSWVYWRHAAVQTTAGGSFFISTDNYGRFHVYRAINRDPSWVVAPAKYKTYTPPYPDWVTLPSPTNYLDFDSDWLWQFNSDATKCVSLPWHSEPNGFVKYAKPPGGKQYATMLPEDIPGDATRPDWFVDAHDDTPGLTEFGISITVTGPGEMDFDVTFTLLRNSYFGDDHRFFFDAAYFMNDVEKIGVPKDTLLTAEIECLVPSTYYEATMGSPVLAYDGVRNMQSSCVINANDMSLTGTQKLRFSLWSPMDIKFPSDYNIRTNGYPTYAFPAQIPFGALGGSNVDTLHGPEPFFPVGPTRYADGDYGSVPRLDGAFLSLDLASFSILYQTFNFTTQEGSTRGVAFGKEFYRKDYSLATSPRTTPPFLTATQVVPSARPYQAVFNLAFQALPGIEFAAHPAGHWSLAVPGEITRDPAATYAASLPEDLDWISVVTGKNTDGTPIRTRHRHKDLYNGAFTQNRDYSFYTPAPYGDQLGSFRPAAFWVGF